MHFTWSHFLVKFCSVTSQMAGLSEREADIMVSPRPPCLFLVQVPGLRVSGNPGEWSQAAISVSRLIPSRLCRYWNRRKDQPFSLSSPKNGKEVNMLPESAASASEKEQFFLHRESCRWRNSLRPVVGRQRRHQTIREMLAAKWENQLQYFSVLGYFEGGNKKSLHPHLPELLWQKSSYVTELLSGFSSFSFLRFFSATV